MTTDAVSRTTKVERTGRHKWVKCQTDGHMKLGQTDCEARLEIYAAVVESSGLYEGLIYSAP